MQSNIDTGTGKKEQVRRNGQSEKRKIERGSRENNMERTLCECLFLNLARTKEANSRNMSSFFLLSRIVQYSMNRVCTHEEINMNRT